MKFPAGQPNMQAMMKQAAAMQKQLEQAKAELAETLVEASSGGGMVSVQFSGAYELLDLKIKPEAASPDDIEMTEDLVIAAINEALAQVTKLREETLPL